mgnify:FL=1
MNYGYIKVASAILGVKVGDCRYNLQEIEKMTAQAEGQGVEIIVFPELSVTGYSCQDLFSQQLLIEEAERAVMMLLDFTRQLDIIVIVGVPVAASGVLLNCGVVVQRGSVLAVIPKTFLPNYGEFYEKRWFASARELMPTEVLFAGSRMEVSARPTVFRTHTGASFAVEQIGRASCRERV